MDYKRLRFKKEEGEFLELDKDSIIPITYDLTCLQHRVSGEFKGSGIHLSDKYDWVIGRDGSGLLVLLCLEKERNK